jgi:hypothetical protein
VLTAVSTVIYLVPSAESWFGPFARAAEEGLRIRSRLEESMRSASRSSRTWISHARPLNHVLREQFLCAKAVGNSLNTQVEGAACLRHDASLIRQA